MEYIKKEELIEGEIYKCDNGSRTYIMKATKDLENVKNIPSYNSFMKHGGFNGSYLTFINATPEEKHWLNTCIEQDKFVSYEKAIKTFIPEYVECILQKDGSIYKLGIIYKTKLNGLIDGGMAFYQMNKERFKLSTKEDYDAQFVVKEPEFILPEKWCIEVTNESRPYIKKYREYINYKPYDIGNYNYQTQTCGNHELRGKELTLEEFKKYILKEETVEEVKIIEPLPQFKVIETIETITKVENNEGNQFFIGDIVKSSNGVIQTIESFDYNKAKTNIIAFTNKQSVLGNGIGINKIEHYIEPKIEIEDDFVLPENWHIVITIENRDIVKKWWNSKNYGDRIWSIGAFYGIDNKDCCSKSERISLPFNNTEITFDQFRKYVLKEEVKEETLLEKAKRLYPVGTKIKSCFGRIGIIKKYNFYEKDEYDGKYIYADGGSYVIYEENTNKWAEIIE